MRQGIRAGRSSQLRRQSDGEFGVENDQLCKEFGVKKNSFSLGRFERDHRTASDFTAGACGGRDSNERRQCRPVGFVVKTFELKSGTFDKQSGRLPDIQRAATTERDYAVTSVLLK